MPNDFYDQDVRNILERIAMAMERIASAMERKSAAPSESYPGGDINDQT
jgi:hypothetical protein